ncbi:MAG: HD domain-containing protein [Saprospiraceae bacterium]|nr:HD domain-containing protein [Saprospiraceae bacterium]
MKYQEFKKYILAELDENLPSDLYYHSYDHILDVYNASRRLAESEGVSPEDRSILYTAVFLHDSGFMETTHKGHEKRSCDIARRILPDYDYTEAQIDHICDMIMATKIPQSPKDELGQIICDADLDYLGRDDFDKISHQLYLEMKAYDLVSNIQEWNKIQVNFFHDHHYFTDTAKSTRAAKKAEHLKELEDIVASYGHSQ